ncbi:MAG: DUF3108 domain-containing protein [Halioglobus sp.]
MIAHFSPQLEFSIPRPLLSLLTGALACLFAATTAFAEDAGQGLQLKPYSVQYTTKIKGISLTLDRKLVRKANNQYELSNGGSKLVVSLKEKSTFGVENGRIVPGSYVYQISGVTNRRREIHFTAGADTVRSLYKENWYELPYTSNTFDRMSQQEEVRLQLMQDETPKETVIVTVADGKRVKDYQLDFVGEETLETPIGPVKTLHFERQHDDPERKSDTWLAPAWDYMMVKTVHVEDGSPTEVNLVSASIDGVALKAK